MRPLERRMKCLNFYESLSHSKWNCKYHVGFVPKRRRKAFFGQARRHLGEIFDALARQKESIVVEIVGAETRDASTLFSVLNAIVTIPVLYMIQLDGLGFRRFGTHGLLWTDAGANLIVFTPLIAKKPTV